MLLREPRFGIEAVDLGNAPVHEQQNDVLRPCRTNRSIHGPSPLSHQSGQRKPAEPVRRAPEHVAAGEETFVVPTSSEVEELLVIEEYMRDRGPAFDRG
jgi:hypothetical protein